MICPAVVINKQIICFLYAKQLVTIIVYFSGNAFLSPHGWVNENNKPFVTVDKGKRKGCCCGGWWDGACGGVRLTGYYGRDTTGFRGVVWYPLSKHLAYADMKIKLN